MTAVAESGSTALWIRYHPTEAGKHEIVVSPDRDLSPELLCVANLAAAWLAAYFAEQGGG